MTAASSGNVPAAAARRVLVAALAAAAALAVGCTPRAKAPPAPRQGVLHAPAADRETPPAAARRGASPPAAALPPAAAEEACAARLHDLGGLLLHYFLINGRLPQRLEDLAPLAAEDGTDFQTTCPATGKRYVYVPAGLPGPGPDLLLVFDAVPSHRGLRSVILASPPQGERPLATWVVPYTEEQFRGHAPAAPNGE